jgi:hypothetical protein
MFSSGTFAYVTRFGSGNEEGAMLVRPGARVRCAALLVLGLSATGCGHLWHHASAPPAAPVHELDIGGANAAEAFPQYWKRNTLLVDLSAASGSGSITLKPVAGSSWPVRLAFRVTPGAIGVLEVHAAQRTALPIVVGSAQPVDLELTPGVYTPQTPEISVSWGPVGAPPP